MSFGCCFNGCSKKNKKNRKKDDFEAVDKFLVDYAIKYRLYTPPSCTLLRNRLAYVVQWRHLKTRSELIDFKVIPQEGLNGDLLTNVGQLINKNGNNNQSHHDDGAKEGLSDTERTAASRAKNHNSVARSHSVTERIANLASDARSKLKTKKQTKTATIDALEVESPHEMSTEQKRGQIEIRRHPQAEEERVETSLIEHKPESRELSLFKTEYTNSSGGTQKFTFQTERRTTSSIQVNVQKSYTIGGQLDLSFALPLDTISLSGEYQVTKSRDESFQKEQVWTVNNEVEVNPGEKVIAEMKVMEEKVLATFKIKNTVSMMPLSRHIPIHVVRKSDLKKHPDKRKVLDVFSLKDHNLHKAFMNEEAERAGIRVNPDKNTIEFESEGSMNLVYQSRQVIDVRLDKMYNGEIKQSDNKKKVSTITETPQGTYEGTGDVTGMKKQAMVMSQVPKPDHWNVDTEETLSGSTVIEGEVNIGYNKEIES